MTVGLEEIEINYKERYPNFINGIISIENLILDIALEKMKDPKLLVNKDLRLFVFERFVSIVSSTKIVLILLNDFVNKPNWEIEFKEKFISKRIDADKLGYSNLRQIDSAQRFLFFQFIFSQFESTMKNFIHYFKTKNIHVSDNWFIYITTNLKIRTDKDPLLNILKETRNSIHNNGIFISKGKSQLRFEYKERVFEFTHGTAVNLDWEDAIFLTKEIIYLTLEITKTEIISKEDCIVDWSCI